MKQWNKESREKEGFFIETSLNCFMAQSCRKTLRLHSEIRSLDAGMSTQMTEDGIYSNTFMEIEIRPSWSRTHRGSI